MITLKGLMMSLRCSRAQLRWRWLKLKVQAVLTVMSAGAADSPPALGSTSGTSTRAARHHGTRHHRMYMMSVNRTHKGSKLTPANNDKPLSEWLHRP